ncbi:MAG: hypothetical protein J6S81_08235, partial [Treponema sp.]|nr:hypothetical protein [Treponema sp.]
LLVVAEKLHPNNEPALLCIQAPFDKLRERIPCVSEKLHPNKNWHFVAYKPLREPRERLFVLVNNRAVAPPTDDAPSLALLFLAS